LRKKLALASSELILPTIYPRLSAFNLLPTLPSSLTDFLFATTELNRERNAAILSDAHTAVLILNRAGIEPVALKGLAYLLAGIFPDAAERFLLDVDLLIPEAQIPAAIQTLAAAGYTTPPLALDRVAAFRHHAPPMYRSGGGVSIELHHCIGLGLPQRILPADEILKHAAVVTLENGARVRLPSPEHLVTHLIVHSQVRHAYGERIWPPLRGMYDLLCLRLGHRDLEVNWPSIEQRFRAAGQQTTLKLHLLQVEGTLGLACPIPIVLSPPEHLRWLRRRLLNRLPGLRFIDPVYLVLATLSRRARLLRAILGTPGGYKSAIRTVVTPGFYRRLFRDLGK
jgi:hypothetical protein